MDLYHLIYVSAATVELPDRELDAILASSYRHNAQQSVTGMLLYARGGFMQVLEGEKASIDEVYRRICVDPRHHSLIQLTYAPIATRSFAQWRMGFRRFRPEEAIEHAAYLPFVVRGFDVRALQAKPGIALEILHYFSAH